MESRFAKRASASPPTRRNENAPYTWGYARRISRHPPVSPPASCAGDRRTAAAHGTHARGAGVGAGPGTRGGRRLRPAPGPPDDRIFTGGGPRTRDAVPCGARMPHGDPRPGAARQVPCRLSGVALQSPAGGGLDGATQDFRNPARRRGHSRHLSDPFAVRRPDRQGCGGGSVTHAKRQAAQCATPRRHAAVGPPPGGRRGDDLPRCRGPLAPPAWVAHGRGRGAALRGVGGGHSRQRRLAAG